jgi:hypothetical protein
LAVPAMVHDMKLRLDALIYNSPSEAERRKKQHFGMFINQRYLAACESDGLFSSAPALASDTDGKALATNPSATPGLTDSQLRKINEVITLANGFGSRFPFTAENVMDLRYQTKTTEIPDVNRPIRGPWYNPQCTYVHFLEIRSLWAHGQWDDAARMAEERLSKNPYDLPGLLIKNDYADSTGAVDDFLDSAKAILVVVQQIKTPALSALLPILVHDLKGKADMLTSTNPAVLAAKKENRPILITDLDSCIDYALQHDMVLQACESDGLF